MKETDCCTLGDTRGYLSGPMCRTLPPCDFQALLAPYNTNPIPFIFSDTNIDRMTADSVKTSCVSLSVFCMQYANGVSTPPEVYCVVKCL